MTRLPLGETGLYLDLRPPPADADAKMMARCEAGFPRDDLKHHVARRHWHIGAAHRSVPPRVGAVRRREALCNALAPGVAQHCSKGRRRLTRQKAYSLVVVAVEIGEIGA